MVQAGGSDSTAVPEPPCESLINKTLDPLGQMVHPRLEALFAPAEIAEFKTIFIARHLIANEIERLMGVLDAMDADSDLELNLAGHQWCDDPRCDDAECDQEESEPSLAATDDVNQDLAGWADRTYYRMDDLELDDQDDEPSNGALERVDQRVWAAGSVDDREMEVRSRSGRLSAGTAR